MTRTARQFFAHSTFNSCRPRVSEREYRSLIRLVLKRSPRKASDPEDRIVIPGYENLRAFSQDYEFLLKQECGGAWRSYVQRGNWRMVFPFSRSHQAKLATKLYNELPDGWPLILHLVRFPQLTINHAVLAIGVTESQQEIVFWIYDPNLPEGACKLLYDRQARTFRLEPNIYFPGGRVDAYEIFHNCLY